MLDERLYRIVLERIEGVDPDTATLVLAAFDSADALRSVLDGAPAPARDETETAAVPERAWIRTLRVEGFRGIGSSAALTLEPGPGLTLVTGRNGSGKSSFAEALEVLLTGDSRRFTDRSAVWRGGWRNLHQPHVRIEAELNVEGRRGRTTVTRTWDDGADLEQGRTEPPLHWEEALRSYRPFLSYNELGSMLDEGPSKLYDALSSILGLDALVATEKALRDARLERERALKDSRTALDGLLPALRGIDDPRAERAVAALAGPSWDLDALDEVLTDAVADGETDLGTLRQLASLQPPDPGDAASAIRTAHARVQAIAGTDAGRARDLAGLLDQALRHHAGHGDGDCPVCGRTSALEAAWRERTEHEVSRLRELAHEADDAHRALSRVHDEVRQLFTTTPPVLQRALDVGIDATDVQRAWKEWSLAPTDGEPVALADHIEATSGAIAAAVASLREAASTELDRREDAWRPVANGLRSWSASARPAQSGGDRVPGLRSAEAWVKSASADVRDERFAPIANGAQKVWEMLRQQSSVELGAVRLTGSGPARKVSLDVTVDGVEGAALGVMSQGELHSLALALFLPRATLPESPFRFIVIDDPVQSMDPAKVDGLARVLESAGSSHQVVVFTHDARLPEALRRLGIDARMIEVTRREGSVVELREALDPVRRYLLDAFSLVKTENLPAKVGARVVPGLCRLAIEAACTDVVRRRRIARGDAYEDVEKVLSDAKRLTDFAALALFDDASRGGDVLRRLNREFSREAADAFQACNRGAHEPHEGPLQRLVQGAETLARKLSQLS